MHRLIPIAVSAAVALSMASLTASHALTPAQSGAIAAKAKADAALRAKIQAAIKARSEALAAKTRAAAIADAKAKAQVKLNVRAETKHRIEAAEKAARLQRQVVTVRVEGTGKVATPAVGTPGVRHADGQGHARVHAVTPHGHGEEHHATKGGPSGHGR
jgi:hypothetical protein